MFKRKFDDTISVPPVHSLPANDKQDASHLAVPQPAAAPTPAPAPAPASAGLQAKTDEDNGLSAQHISIISNDLTILGKDLEIISKGAVQVDGEIRGDIRGVEVTVGGNGKVVGKVMGEHVVVDGVVLGEIEGKEVVLRSHARVDGDINHKLLTINVGAVFDGRSKRQEYAPEPIEQDRAPSQMRQEQVPEYNPNLGMRAPERS